jgi:peptide chain release factor 1
MSRLNLKEHLSRLLNRFDEVEAALADPVVLADPVRFRSLSSEHSRRRNDMADVRRYLELLKSKEEAEALLQGNDEELKQMAREELLTVEEELSRRAFDMESLLLDPDPNEGRGVIVEIRAGTGGEEAALFAGDLFRMYSRLCDREGLRLEMLSESESELGGFKEVIFSVEGASAWRLLHNEGGAHRVQRIPATESQGRIHTSAVTVAVLPEAEEDEVELDEKDLRVDVYRASGAGGQHVNKTESAVRLTHIPTGLVVTCQDERSQHKNRAKAMKVLRSRLKQMEEETRHKEMADLKKSQVKTGDRSERIRTYNFPQGRVTDHRVGVTLYNLAEFMEGSMNEILEALVRHEKEEQLEQLRRREIG